MQNDTFCEITFRVWVCTSSSVEYQVRPRTSASEKRLGFPRRPRPRRSCGRVTMRDPCLEELTFYNHLINTSDKRLGFPRRPRPRRSCGRVTMRDPCLEELV